MKTAIITAYGGPDVLELRDAPIPEAGPDEALVAVVASTINPVDVKTRSPGTPQELGQFPAVLGWDIAGIVISAPADSPWRAGDRVIAMHPPGEAGTGSWATYVAIPTGRLAPAPETIGLLAAATLPLAGLAADQALRRLALEPGERLLVTGAAGAVGGIGAQLAAHGSVAVAGLVSRPEHRDAVRELGVAEVFSDPAQTGGFDAILDTAGVFDHPHLLRDGGRLVTVSDDTIPATLMSKAANAEHNYVQHDPERLNALSHLVDHGHLRLRVAAHYPLNEIRRAHERQEAGGLLGKIVLSM